MLTVRNGHGGKGGKKSDGVGDNIGFRFME